MEKVAGVFVSRADAEHAARKLLSMGVPRDKINLFAPAPTIRFVRGVAKGSSASEGDHVEIDNGQKGLAHELELGPVTRADVPDAGTIMAVGPAAEALLDLAGADFPAGKGNGSGRIAVHDLPRDELFVYTGAWRQGRSVLLALAEGRDEAASTRQVLEAEGAKSVDAAREDWWKRLRRTEELKYSHSGRDFGRDERVYRLGFEAAVNARTRCKEYDQVLAEMVTDLEELQQAYADADLEEPFRRGYESGRGYYEGICDQLAK